MKKEMFLLAVSALLFSQFASAEYNCSNNTEMKRSIDEIKVGYVKYFGGIGIGTIYSRETPALGRAEAELIIGAQRVTLDLTNKPKEKVEIPTGNVEVELTKVGEGNVSLNIGGASYTFEERTYQKAGNYDVFISKAYPEINKSDFILGDEKIYLSNNGPENYKTKIKNDSLFIQLESASFDNAIISVIKCVNSDVVEIERNRNITIGEVPSDNANITTNASANIGSTNLSNVSIEAPENKKSLGLSCMEDNECFSNLCHRNKCVKRYFFDKIIDWFKNLF